MKKITKFLILSVFSIFLFTSCDDEAAFERINYVSFQSNSLFFGVEEGTETSMDVKIYTNNVTSSDRTFEISVVTDDTTAEPTAYTVPATVTVPGGQNEGTISIGLRDYADLVDDKVLKIKLEQDGDFFAGEDLTFTLSRLCPNNGVKIAITLGFDNWPEEAAWRIKDSTGAVVLASADPLAFGAYAANPDGSSTTEKYCLASGTYTIEVFDGYSDGGTSYAITANGFEIYTLASDGYTGSTSGTLTF